MKKKVFLALNKTKKITDQVITKVDVRTWYILAGVSSFLIVLFAIFAQHFWNLNPCPLCIFQRIAFIISGCVFLTSAFFLEPHSKLRYKVWIHLVALIAPIIGMAIALRHIFLIHKSTVDGAFNSCGANLNYMLESFPFSQVMQTVFNATGDCTKVDWTMLGFSMPIWSAVCFAVLFFSPIVGIFYREREDVNKVNVIQINEGDTLDEILFD